MPQYGLVTNAIGDLANRVRGLRQDELAHQRQMQSLDLANARLGLEAQTLAGNREIQMAKFKREQYLDEPTPLSEVIRTSKFPDENKAALMKQFEPILNVPTTRRKFGETLFKYLQSQQKQGMSEAELTQRALRGDQESQAILDRMAERKAGTARAGASRINVTTQEGVKQLGTKEATKKYAEKIGERVDTRFQQASEANRQNAQLDQIALAISQGARTGVGEETLLNIRSFAQTIGVDTGDLSGQEVVRKISNEMALRLRNPESGLGLTGNTSNKDLDFLKASVVGLSRTEQGNIAIINAMRKFNKMKIDTANKQNEIIQKNGGVVPIDLDSKILNYVNSYELFTKSERAKIESTLGNKKQFGAPQQAIDYLREHPELKDAFKTKYGYLPDGF